MQWLGWIYICDHHRCSNTKMTSTDAPVAALVEAVLDGWMPAHIAPGRRDRIFCPEHVAHAKVPHQSGPKARSLR